MTDKFPEALFNQSPQLKLPKTVNPAAWTYERLVKYIDAFENELDQEHEIGARLVSFGQNVTFHILNIGYWGPDIITFDGINNDNKPIKLIQNVSQLSILLVAMDKINKEPKRIGFLLEQQLKENEKEK